GSSEGADFQSEVPDEPKAKSIYTSERISLKPGVPDVSTGDSSKSKNDSWGDSGDEANEQADDEDVRDSSDEDVLESDDDHEQADDERRESNDEEEETQYDEYIHTPDDYVPTDDETNNKSDDISEKEYERINEELYDDVNVSLTDVEPADKEKDDEEMTVAGHMNVNQEGAGNQVKDDAQETQKTEGLILSSSISSDYAAKYLNFDNIPPVDTEVVSMLDIDVQHEVSHTSPLLTILVFIIPGHTVDNPPEIVTTTSSTIISSLLSSLFPHLQQLKPIPTPMTTEATTSTPAVSNSETLTTLQLRVTDSKKDVKELKEVILKNIAGIIKEHSVPVKTIERLGQQYAPHKSVEDI
ncbi:hypothetical protein Tco_1560561, partial [Tanacetum coccineum]